tara:strand:+ start:277 stop:1590 length:1314 start_codon:yes stop_codon:yes gene_type:complete
MTSGRFISLAIDSIGINRDDRQRRELTDLESLAESIRNVGLINPIIVDHENNLVAGERRFTACRDILGWTHITAQRAEELPRDTLYLIELEENVKRVDLDWRDQCNAIAEYNRLQLSINAKWTQHQTATALGITPSEVASKISVAKALDEGDPLVAAADKYSVARGIVERKQARAFDSVGNKMSAMLSGKSVEEISEEVERESDDLAEDYVPPVAVPFLNTDFTEWSSTYVGPKFNFLHCDFPYGVNAGNHNQGAASAFGGYADSAEVYWSLLDSLRLVMDSLVAESAHMMFWFSLDYYTETKRVLESMGWKVSPFPLIWHKSDNSGILPDFKRGPRRIYETAFLCSRGDRLIVQAVSNVCAAPNTKTIHMSEKNPEMLAYFFRMFVDESTYMLDPTMGSGHAVRVAENLGASHALGLERDQEFFAKASEAYIAAQE